MSVLSHRSACPVCGGMVVVTSTPLAYSERCGKHDCFLHSFVYRDRFVRERLGVKEAMWHVSAGDAERECLNLDWMAHLTLIRQKRVAPCPPG